MESAGAMSRTSKLGYIAPIPEVDILSGINAFTLGARMVNPGAELNIKWLELIGEELDTAQATRELAELGIDIICHHNTLVDRSFSKEYGVYHKRKC